MAKLVDTTKWREFRVGNLFYKCELKWRGNHAFNKALDVSDVPDDEFNLPLVNAKLGGNGIMFYGRESEWDSVEMSIDIVSNGASAVGSVYAQPQKTGVLWDAYLVKCRDTVSANVLQFLATVMESQIKQHFSYDNKCTWNKVKLLSINLPVTPDGKPDWDYMEQYMAHVMDEMRSVAEELYSLDSKLKPHKLDTTEWKMFKVGDLFEKCELRWHGDHEFNKALDVSDSPSDEFNLPLVNAKLGDNGIMFYGHEAEWDSVEMSIDIVGDGASAVGSVYAQPQRTGVLYNAYLVKCEEIVNADTLQFIATVMESQIKQHFSYDNKCTWNKVKLLNIVLPATLDGRPDWDAMAEMMHGYTDSVRDVAEVLFHVSS